MGKPVEDVVLPAAPAVTEGDATAEPTPAPTTEAAFEQSEAASAGLTTLGDLDGI